MNPPTRVFTLAEINELEQRIYPHRRAYYAKDFARWRRGYTHHGTRARVLTGCECQKCMRVEKKQRKSA